MRAEIDLGCNILRVVPRITIDRLIYRHINPNEPVGPVTAAAFYDVRYHLGLSAREIANSHLLPIMHAVMHLFNRYDDLVDTSSEMPSIEAAYNDPKAQEYRKRIQAAVLAIQVPQNRQQAMLDAINSEVYFQYNLHCKYAAKGAPLSAADAFTFRESAGGSLVALMPRFLSLQFDRHGPRVEVMLKSGYWYGAIIQLIDDVGDIDTDLPNGIQNAFRSCLYENPDELNRIREGIERSSFHGYKSLEQSAPKSLGRIHKQWNVYYGNILREAEYPIFHSLLKPTNMGLLIPTYSRLSRQYRSRAESS